MRKGILDMARSVLAYQILELNGNRWYVVVGISVIRGTQTIRRSGKKQHQAENCATQPSVDQNTHVPFNPLSHSVAQTVRV